MIRSLDMTDKQVGLIVLTTLFACILSAPLAAQPRSADCSVLFDAVDREFYTIYERGGNDWTDLEPLLAEAKRCFGDTRTAAHADLLNYESSVLVKQRRHAESEAVFERFFADFASVADPEVVAKMYLRRGYAYGRLGWTAAMLSEYAKAAALAGQLPAPAAASTLRNAGEYYAQVNDLDTAARYFAAAESLLVRVYDDDAETHGTELGIVRLRQAHVLLDEEEQGWRTPEETHAAVRPLLESALQLLPATPANAYYRILALFALIELHWLQGTPATALAAIAEAHRLRPWIEDAYPHLESRIWRKEAYTRYLLGTYADAIQAYETALALARRAEEREEVMWALIGLGEVAEARADGTPRPFLQQAEAHFREAATVAEELRASYGTHDWSASAWELTQEPYLHLTRVLLQQGRAAEAFLTLDETRARYLRDLRASAQLHRRLDASARLRLDSLTSAQQAARYRLGQRQLATPERTRLELQVVETQRAIEALTGRYANASRDTLSLDALQRILRDRGQTLLSFFFDGDKAWAFVVRPDTLAALRLATDADQIQAELGAIGGAWHHSAAPSPRIDLAPLHRLYTTLFAPVSSLIPASTELVVIPEGPLSVFPLGLLIEQPHDRFAYADAPYLLRRYAISTELAAGLLVAPAPSSEHTLALLALGRSRFGGLRPTALGSEEAAPLEDLPAVETELARLRRHIGEARFALDEEATEAFLDQHIAEARLLHLASHALIHPSLPLYSQIVLWDDPQADDDGTLFLYELQNRALAVDLAVLSGCSTARGQRRTGEGMLGLQYAFRAAGAQATLATLWQVDDRASSDLFDRFYHHLGSGRTKSEALQRAQLDYLADHEGLRASPFFWAAPVLYGDTSSMSLPPGAPSPLWLPFGIALVLAGLVLPRLLSRSPRV